MALPNWGELTKATDDSTTIVEYVAEQIAAHDANSDSHLATGGSLDSHKTAYVIDHPATSILPDKTSVADPSQVTYFDSITGFTKVGTVTNSSWPGATFEVPPASGHISSLKANMAGLVTTSPTTYSILFDVYFNIDPNDSTYIINAGLMSNAMTTYYLGFRVSAGHLIGFARWSGSEHTTSTLLTISSAQNVLVRVYYDYGANTIHYYVNGTDVAQLTPGAALQLDNQFGLKFDDNSGDGGIWRVYSLYFTRSI